ncbi:hypothetical protein MTR_7g020880 [Medicago truncatula]|uniref:Uncharacterized protein n=1 Tax=Medicago truncatula TaxID=3880 RepID=G7KSV9_MEDTR|nr:hypothetical protein MTR_7g020880 [Medicago truncatula]
MQWNHEQLLVVEAEEIGLWEYGERNVEILSFGGRRMRKSVEDKLHRIFFVVKCLAKNNFAFIGSKEKFY